MPKMSMKEALAAVLQDIRAMSVEEKRRALHEHRNDPFVLAMEEMGARVVVRMPRQRSVFRYGVGHFDAHSIPKGAATGGKFHIAEVSTANDNMFALAA